jgi:hypothetical protein
MKSENQVPIMTNSESLLQFGNNAYAKPSTALIILRETILGRELFDFAFREYSRRWKFRRPTPADFFRTMEEASGVDLDWFWRGWFYSTDHVDISIDRVTRFKVASHDPDVEFPHQREEIESEPPSLTRENNAAEGRVTRQDRYPGLEDFYNENDQFTVSNKDRKEFREYLKSIREPLASDPEWRSKALQRAIEEDKNFYMMEFSSPGGLVMPILLEITYTDGTTESLRIPAEIWRYSPGQVNKLIARDGEIATIVVDPQWETADVDVSNNHYPRKFIPSRLEIYKAERRRNDLPERDLMQDIKTELDSGEEEVPLKVEPAEQ